MPRLLSRLAESARNAAISNISLCLFLGPGEEWEGDPDTGFALDCVRSGGGGGVYIGFRVQGLGSRVQGLGLRATVNKRTRHGRRKSLQTWGSKKQQADVQEHVRQVGEVRRPGLHVAAG